MITNMENEYHPSFMVSCDDCGFEADYDGYEFLDMIEDMKETGWRIRPVNGVWEHFCEKCKSRHEKPKRRIVRGVK